MKLKVKCVKVKSNCLFKRKSFCLFSAQLSCFVVALIFTKKTLFWPQGPVSVWQSATLLQISCKSVQPVPARVEERVSPVRQFSVGGVTNNSPFPKVALASMGK